MNVLLRFNHGLGDAVQFTVVLKHLRHFHPDWTIDVRSLRGKHSAFHGLCRRSYHDQEAAPLGPQRVFDIQWLENYNRYPDRPNSKITNCLEEVFHLPYQEDLGRYEIQVGDSAQPRAAAYLESIGCIRRDGSLADASGCCDGDGRYNAIIFHYQGNTSQHKKNLGHDTVAGWVELCLEAGYLPVILDWDRRSPLIDQKRVFNPAVHAGDIWGGFGSGDAETITALIGAATAFVGIDSGPGKCASATETPSLICWTGHHPIQFHDPAENTVHLVPDNHRQIPPAQNAGVADYFVKHYRHRTYPAGRERNLEAAGAEWLAETIERNAKFECRNSKQIRNTNVENKSETEMGSELRAEGFVFRWGFWIPAEQPMQAWTIIDDIFVKDAYKTYLRPRRDGEEYVVDVGANIGAFAALWHKRNPRARIACLEVNPKLIPALEANVGEFATVLPYACHYDRELYLLDAVCSAGLSIGGSRVVDRETFVAEKDPQYLKSEERVAAVTLEEVQERLGFPWIDVLKMDCEGSEFSILESCDLGRVGTIFIESHGAERWRRLLASRFQGWDIGHMSRSACGEFENWHLVNPRPPRK